MPNYGIVDLTGAPPAQGRAPLAHIPPGPYVLEVASFELKTKPGPKGDLAESCRIRLAVAEGEYVNSEIGEFFSFTSTSKYPMQRFHSFLLALGFAVEERAFRLDFEQMVDRRCIGHVVDRTLEGKTDDNGKTWEPRTISTVGSYEPMPAAAAKVAAPKASAPAPKAAAAEPLTDDVAGDVEDLFPD